MAIIVMAVTVMVVVLVRVVAIDGGLLVCSVFFDDCFMLVFFISFRCLPSCCSHCCPCPSWCSSCFSRFFGMP